jgi:hypothetical protein
MRKWVCHTNGELNGWSFPFNVFQCKYIDGETFHMLDENYEHIFAMLHSMEKKADTFCRPSSKRSGRPFPIGPP